MNIASPSQYLSNKCKTVKVSKEILVPTLAVAALFTEANRVEEEHGEHGAMYSLAGNMSKIIMSVILQPLKAFPLIAAAYVGIDTLDKKSKHDKIASVVKNTVWLGCGVAIQKLCSSRLLNGNINNYREVKLFAFLADICAFAVGSLLVAPFINKLISKCVHSSCHQKHIKENDYTAHLEETLPYPISMDKTGVIGKDIKPEEHPASPYRAGKSH